VQRDGVIYINDQPFQMTQVSEFVGPLYASTDRRLVISIRGDREVPYRTIDQLQKELVAAGVVRVVFATELEQRVTRARR
jgi:biopolymer transport protein ExbD